MSITKYVTYFNLCAIFMTIAFVHITYAEVQTMDEKIKDCVNKIDSLQNVVDSYNAQKPDTLYIKYEQIINSNIKHVKK
jgi:hypothetical protein